MSRTPSSRQGKRLILAGKEWALFRPIIIHADWDPEAEVWVATAADLRGLVTEADSIEALRAKLPGMILDLLEETGAFDVPASIEIVAHATDPSSAAIFSRIL